jgi:GNAT superfamily N-acetyltransferase
MNDLRRSPEISSAPTDRPFVQLIELAPDRRSPPMARALWCTCGEPTTAQIIEIFVDPAHRLRGLGGRLIDAIVAEVRSLNASRAPTQRIRVIWLVAAHRSHITLRGFLTRHGFHHAGSSRHLYLGEDAMIYSKALD